MKTFQLATRFSNGIDQLDDTVTTFEVNDTTFVRVVTEFTGRGVYCTPQDLPLEEARDMWRYLVALGARRVR